MSAVLVVLFAFVASAAQAAPLVFDFRQAQYDPQGAGAITAVQPGLPRITVTADGPNTSLYWDETDGLGITGPSYSDDEVEGRAEILRVTFDTPQRIIGIGLSDLFFESESSPSAPPCFVYWWPTCYRERGQYSYNGGTTWLDFEAPESNLRWLTNGEYSFSTFVWTSELLFRAPGAIQPPGFPYTQLHEFSLMTLTLKEHLDPVPEPATLSLLGIGLLGAGWWRRRVQ